MADNFSEHGTGLDSPASNAIAVTPGVSALGNVTRALYVGAAGDAPDTKPTLRATHSQGHEGEGID